LTPAMACSPATLCSGAGLTVPSDRLWTVRIRSHRLDHNRSTGSCGLGPRCRVSTHFTGPLHTCGAAHQSLAATRLPRPQRVKPVVRHASFAEKPLYFCRFNPQSILIQSNCFSVLFLFTLDPVFSRISTRSPRTRYSTILFKFKFVLFIEMPLHLKSCITFAFQVRFE